MSKVAITLGIAPSSITMASQAILQQTKEWIAEKTKEEGEASAFFTLSNHSLSTNSIIA